MGLFEVERRSSTSATFNVDIPDLPSVNVLYTPSDGLFKCYSSRRQSLPDFTIGVDWSSKFWTINPDKFIPHNFLQGCIHLGDTTRVFIFPNNPTQEQNQIATITPDSIVLNRSSGTVEIDSTQARQVLENQLKNSCLGPHFERKGVKEQGVSGLVACAVISYWLSSKNSNS